MAELLSFDTYPTLPSHLALSVVSRGFFLANANKQANLWDWREKICCITLSILVAVIVSSKISYLLSEQGFYFGVLRQAYDWTKLHL